MFNKGEYIGHLETAIEDTADSDLLPMLSQILTQQIVSPPYKWWQNKLNQIFVIHPAIN